MKIKISVLILNSILIYNFVVGQSLKTYSGSFQEGYATYQYYENENQERIFSGKFSYKEINHNSNLEYDTLKIEGQFKDDKKDGIWKYTKRTRSLFSSVSTTLVGKFELGEIIGEWNYLYFDKYKGKEVRRDIKTANFNKNIFIGNLTSSIRQMNMTPQNINIHFNNDGFIDGVIPIQYVDEGNHKSCEAKFYFKDGFFYKSFLRHLSDGEIVESLDETNLVTNFIEKYDNQKNESIVDGKRYTKKFYKLKLNEGRDFSDNGHWYRPCLLTGKILDDEFKETDDGFLSVIDTRIDAYSKISDELYYWLDIINGKFFKIARGSTSEIIYPKVALVYISDKNEAYFINHGPE